MKALVPATALGPGTRVVPALAGAVLALYGAALVNATAALFWPRAATELLFLCACVGGVAALACALAPARLRDRAQASDAVLLAGGLASAAGSLVALGGISRSLLPGPGLGLLSFPPWFLALAAAPFAAVALTAASWRCSGAGRRGGWLVAGLGAGCLAAAGLGASSLLVSTPWFGGRLLEFRDAGGGSAALGVDRRLREDLVAPATGAPLMFVPRAGRDRRIDVLLVGFPNGPVLSTLLKSRKARLTILEEDPALAAAVLERWPALEAARAAGRASFVHGNPRWSLQRLGGRFDLVILSEGWSFGAYLSRALNLRRDHRWTLDAFRSYLAHLAPEGYLFVQRSGMGRVVATLREASGVPGSVFLHRVIVLGSSGRLSSQCWYRAEGLSDRASLRTAVRYSAANQTHLLYKPSKYPTLSFYDPLITSEQVKGLYFSTPLDLSPTLDERPFFDHLERLAISPMGRTMPEELEPRVAQTQLRVIPSGDRGVWAVLLAGLAAGAGLLATGLRRAGRAGGATAAACRAWGPAVYLGFLAAFSLAAFDAWASWLAPSAHAALAAVAALLLGAALGLLAWPGRPVGSAWVGMTGAALSLGAYAAYRAAPSVPGLGFTESAFAVAAVGAVLGALVGRTVGGASRELEERLPGTSALVCGAALWAAALAWIAGTLAATHFGYRLIWALAAVSALAVLRALRTLPALRRVPGNPS